MHQRKRGPPTLGEKSVVADVLTRETGDGIGDGDVVVVRKNHFINPSFHRYFIVWLAGCICGRLSATYDGYQRKYRASVAPWASLSSPYPKLTQHLPPTDASKRLELDLSVLDLWRTNAISVFLSEKPGKLCRGDFDCVSYNRAVSNATTASDGISTSLTREATGYNFGNYKIKVGDELVSVKTISAGYEALFQKLTLHSAVSYLGISLQQDPLDAFVIGDLLWRVQPDLVIELGTSGGGSSFYYEHIMNEYNPHARILTIDPASGSGLSGIPLKQWNDHQVKQHCPFCQHPATTRYEWRNDTSEESGPIRFFRGMPNSILALEIARDAASKAKVVLVIEDSDHQYSSVKANLDSYHQFVTPGSYMVVQDTRLGDPHRAVRKFMKEGADCFHIDKRWEYFVFSQHFDGFLRKRTHC
jgi:cephalosporin hydroxylase|eukprot:scaffold1516_cov192-Alexandrium_tamarense.AAC.38